MVKNCLEKYKFLIVSTHILANKLVSRIVVFKDFTVYAGKLILPIFLDELYFFCLRIKKSFMPIANKITKLLLKANYI